MHICIMGGWFSVSFHFAKYSFFFSSGHPIQILRKSKHTKSVFLDWAVLNALFLFLDFVCVRRVYACVFSRFTKLICFLSHSLSLSFLFSVVHSLIHSMIDSVVVLQHARTLQNLIFQWSHQRNHINIISLSTLSLHSSIHFFFHSAPHRSKFSFYFYPFFPLVLMPNANLNDCVCECWRARAAYCLVYQCSHSFWTVDLQLKIETTVFCVYIYHWTLQNRAIDFKQPLLMTPPHTTYKAKQNK